MPVIRERQMGQPGAILFPHAALPEKLLRRGLSFFGHLTICQPWYMERELPFTEEGLIRILRPPLEFKPSPDFDKLLAEYRTWIRATHKKGVDAFIAFSRERLSRGEALWDIRGCLRSSRDPVAIPFQEKVFKWNLMLHLGQEIEDQGREADRLIEDLRKGSSPLGDLLQEEADTVHPVADLLPFDREFSRNSMDQVLEAWVSLFEARVEGDDVLLTFSGKIFDRLGERWEEERGEACPPPKELLIPDFSDVEPGELSEVKNRFWANEEGISIRHSIMNCGKAVPAKPPEEAFSPRGSPYPKMMKMILRYFPPVPVPGGPMSRFSGKTVCLIKEERSHHE